MNIEQMLEQAVRELRPELPEGAVCLSCGRPVAPGNMAHVVGELPNVYSHATCAMWNSSAPSREHAEEVWS